MKKILATLFTLLICCFLFIGTALSGGMVWGEGTTGFFFFLSVFFTSVITIAVAVNVG